MTADNVERVGHSGLSYPVWWHNAIQDFLHLGRSSLPSHADYLMEFAADANGMLRITHILNPINGKSVQLSEVLSVPVNDLDRIIAAHQQRFLDEWNATKTGEQDCSL